jgi:AbrB family looped-hinge helix DNA binding protein
MKKLAKVSSKGQVVIPAQLRRRLKISRTVMITEEKGKVVIEPSMSFEEAFGSGGKEMRQVAIEISKDRRKEVESERKKLSL